MIDESLNHKVMNLQRKECLVQKNSNICKILSFYKLTGLDLTFLKAGTNKIVMAKNVKVSDDKSLMDSTAPSSQPITTFRWISTKKVLNKINLGKIKVENRVFGAEIFDVVS